MCYLFCSMHLITSISIISTTLFLFLSNSEWFNISSNMHCSYFSRRLLLFLFPFPKMAFTFCLPDLNAWLIGLVISIVWGFSLFANMWSLVILFAVKDSGDIFVFMIFTFKLNPHSTEAWPWLEVRISLTTNNKSLYFEILATCNKNHLTDHPSEKMWPILFA